MVTQQENIERAEKMGLDISCGRDISPSNGQFLCRVGDWLPNHKGFVKYSDYLNAKELHEWLNGYSKRADLYPIDLSKYDVADDLEDKRVPSLYTFDLINFLNENINGWVYDNIDSLKKKGILEED